MTRKTLPGQRWHRRHRHAADPGGSRACQRPGQVGQGGMRAAGDPFGGDLQRERQPPAQPGQFPGGGGLSIDPGGSGGLRQHRHRLGCGQHVEVGALRAVASGQA